MSEVSKIYKIASFWEGYVCEYKVHVIMNCLHNQFICTKCLWKANRDISAHWNKCTLEHFSGVNQIYFSHFMKFKAFSMFICKPCYWSDEVWCAIPVIIWYWAFLHVQTWLSKSTGKEQGDMVTKWKSILKNLNRIKIKKSKILNIFLPEPMGWFQLNVAQSILIGKLNLNSNERPHPFENRDNRDIVVTHRWL